MSELTPDFIHALGWSDATRAQAFSKWLHGLKDAGLRPDSVRLASADASFRRYFRVDSASGTRVIMDAPPEKEDCKPFVKVARLMLEAGLHAPQILDWDEAQGFMLLSDLGQRTLMQLLEPEGGQRICPVSSKPWMCCCPGNRPAGPGCCRLMTRRCCDGSWPCFPIGIWLGTEA